MNYINQNIDIDTLPIGIARVSFDGKHFDLIYANEYLYKTLGFHKEEQLPESPYFGGLFPDITEKSIDKFREEIATTDELTASFKVAYKDNSIATIEVILNVVQRNGNISVFDVCLRDISKFLIEINNKEMLYDHMINYDALTDLPKSIIFTQKCRKFIEKAEANDCFASVYIDINNFKLINEKIGRANGDIFLIDLCKKLEAMCMNRGYLMRAFSDKYLMFLKSTGDNDLKNEIENFIKDFTKQQHDKYPDCNITMGAGICYLGDLDFSISVDYAAIAHKKAKAVHENNCIVFDEQMKTDLNNEMNITNEAEQAIINREFVVYYQPKISLKINKVIGAEALVRWKKPDGTLIPPGLFIPYLEKTSFITKVDFYVYEEVCRLLRHYMDTGTPLIPISVNFSRLHLSDKDFIKKVVMMAEKYHIPHKYIELELTESASLEDEKVAVQTFGNLRKRGFLVSIDDFGSGYSSLNLLKILPADTLKMDKEFFGDKNLQEGGNNAIMVTSIIEMVNKMNISIVCEGVETSEQVEFLRKTECSSVQGYYYAKPMPVDEFEIFKTKFNQ